jgi:hypothetical protein
MLGIDRQRVETRQCEHFDDVRMRRLDPGRGDQVAGPKPLAQAAHAAVLTRPVEASSAPSARLRNFIQTMSGSTAPKPAKVENPQSVPGDHAFGAEQADELQDALGHGTRMLDEVGGRIDHARHQDLVVRNAVRHLGERRPVVGVPGIGRFEQQGRGLGAHQRRQDHRHLDIAMMRAFVIAPADMHPHPVGGHVAQCVVENLHVTGNPLEILLVAAVLVHHVPAEAEIGAVELEVVAGSDDGFIFRAHRFGERFEIGIVVGIEIVRLEESDHSGGGGVHERPRRTMSLECARETAQIVRERLAGRRRDRPDAARPAVGRRAAALACRSRKAGTCSRSAGGLRLLSPSKPLMRSLM